MTSIISQSTTMPPPPIPLTLIVATTPSLGIGLKGSLPWPPLKSDMAFFARVTKRVSPPIASSLSTNLPDGVQPSYGNIKNAVIMGRKTWESIPPKFRPLKDRINVIISRSPEGLRPTLEGQSCDVFATTSIEDALKELKSRFPPLDLGSLSGDKADATGNQKYSATALGRSFIIGGAEIYRLALNMAACERILWTRLSNDFECDTFFPAGVLNVEADSVRSSSQGPDNWTRSSQEELQAWTEEKDAGTSQRDGDVDFRVLMLEKRKVGEHG